MTFKTVSNLAIAAVSVAAFAITFAAYGFAESFAMTSIVMMLPLAFEPLGKTSRRGLVDHQGARPEVIPFSRRVCETRSRFIPIRRHAA